MGRLRRDNSLDIRNMVFWRFTNSGNSFRTKIAQRQQQIQNNPQPEESQNQELE